MMMKLYHYTEKTNLENIMKNGLIPQSRYELLSSLRENVVFCWLSPDHNKMKFEDPVCLEVTVDESVCKITDMEYISLAMMYKHGGGKYGALNTPINMEASDLLVKVYEATAVLPGNYQNHFFTPEVLVKKSIKPECISVYCLAE